MAPISERRADWAVRNFKALVELFDSKTWASLTVVLLVLVILMGYDLRRVYNIRAEGSEERLKRSEDFIYNRVLNRVQPEITQMRANTDSAKAKVDSTVQRMQPLLEKVSEAVDEVNKKRR